MGIPNPFGLIGSVMGAAGSIVGISAAEAGATQGAIGARYSASAESAMDTYQAELATYNEQLARKEAASTAATGVVPLEQIGLATSQQRGLTISSYGAGNIDPTSGTAAKVTASETKAAQMTEATQQYNTNQAVYAQRVTAAQNKAQAGAYTTAAGTAIQVGEISAQAALITGAGNVANKFVQLGQSIGGFGSSLGLGSPGSSATPAAVAQPGTGFSGSSFSFLGA